MMKIARVSGEQKSADPRRRLYARLGALGVLKTSLFEKGFSDLVYKTTGVRVDTLLRWWTAPEEERGVDPISSRIVGTHYDWPFQRTIKSGHHSPALSMVVILHSLQLALRIRHHQSSVNELANIIHQ